MIADDSRNTSFMELKHDVGEGIETVACSDEVEEGAVGLLFTFGGSDEIAHVYLEAVHYVGDESLKQQLEFVMHQLVHLFDVFGVKHNTLVVHKVFKWFHKVWGVQSLLS